MKRYLLIAAGVIVALYALATVMVHSVSIKLDTPETIVEQGDPGPIRAQSFLRTSAGQTLIGTRTGIFFADGTRHSLKFASVSALAESPNGTLLASGHPAPTQENKSELIGVIESKDDGASWQKLAAGVDLHELVVFRDGRLLGYDAFDQTIKISQDGGKSWQERSKFENVFDLAIYKNEPDVIYASDFRGLYRSLDQAQSWTKISGHTGYLAFDNGGRLLVLQNRSLLAKRGERFERVATAPANSVGLFSFGNKIFVSDQRGKLSPIPTR